MHALEPASPEDLRPSAAEGKGACGERSVGSVAQGDSHPVRRLSWLRVGMAVRARPELAGLHRLGGRLLNAASNDVHDAVVCQDGRPLEAWLSEVQRPLALQVPGIRMHRRAVRVQGAREGIQRRVSADDLRPADEGRSMQHFAARRVHQNSRSRRDNEFTAEAGDVEGLPRTKRPFLLSARIKEEEPRATRFIPPRRCQSGIGSEPDVEWVCVDDRPPVGMAFSMPPLI